MKKFAIALIAILSLASPARAINISEETKIGSSFFEQNVGVDGEFGAEDEKSDPPWDWNIGYTYEQTITANAPSPDIIDHTNDFTAGLGWTGEIGFGVNGAFDVSDTPTENLSTKGGTLTASYKWVYEKNEKFSPYLKFKLNAGKTTYTEKYTGVAATRRIGITRPISGEESITGTFFGPELEWKPVSEWKFKAAYSPYHYDKDVLKFQNLLDSPAALRRGMSNFSSTLGGLPKSTFTLGATWYFLEDWNLSGSYSISKNAADNGTSTTVDGKIEFHFAEQWTAHAGVESQASGTINDVSSLFGLEFEF